MPQSTLAIVCVLVITAPAAANGQRSYSLGMGALYGQPVGQFAAHVNPGFGLDVVGRLAADQRGIIALRGESGYVQYDASYGQYEYQRRGSSVVYDHTTRSTIGTLRVGPELTIPLGPVQAYGAVMIGLSFFQTTTELQRTEYYRHSDISYEPVTYTNASDNVFATGGTTGLRIHLGDSGHTRYMLDVGLQYHKNGTARYVGTNGIRENDSVLPTIVTTRTEANLLIYRLGIHITYP